MNAPSNPTRTFTTIRTDENGTPLPGAPRRRYRTFTARMAAAHAAGIALTRDQYRSATMESTQDGTAVMCTFRPLTGAPVHIHVTEDPTPEPEPAAPARAAVDTVTIHATDPNWAPVFAIARADAAAQTRAYAVATRSQWDSALANLRDALQDAGVPPETTDNLVIRHDPEDSWLTDIETGKRVMRVESPSALDDALYGLAWAYSLGRPTPIRLYPIPASQRASQRPTAAV